MAKALFDRVVAFVGLVILLPLFLVVGFMVWRQDGHSPIYAPRRVGRGGKPFHMTKIRSMVTDADKLGGSSTAGDDPRITPIGHFIRRWKLDEFSQLWNVLIGDMSLVGPRPQVEEEVATYTVEEMALLDVKPGITDFASIVFADEAEILRGTDDADLAYRRLIRPWKSRLGLFYVAKHSMRLDVQLVTVTIVRIACPDRALTLVSSMLDRLGAPKDLVQVARRTTPLIPSAVPGRDHPF